MSDPAFVPLHVGDRVLLMVGAMLVLMSLLVAGLVGNTIAAEVRPSDEEVRTLIAFGGFMITTIGVTSPFAQRFDRRNKARLDRVRALTATAPSIVAAKVRSIRLPLWF